MSHNQRRDSSPTRVDDVTVEQLRDYLDLYYPGDPKPVGLFTPLEDWSNPQLGVPVLLVRRPKVPYVD